MAGHLSKGIGDALPVNLAYMQPAGPGISAMIGEHENVIVRFLTDQDFQQRDQKTLPASIFLNRTNGSMLQLFYMPKINQIQVTFGLTEELKSMGTTSTWFTDYVLTDSEPVLSSLESVSMVKIIIGIADNVLANRLLQSFQAAFGRVRVQDGLHENWFRALWESAKVQMAHSPTDKQARRDFAYAYALLRGSGGARRADKEAWERRQLGMQDSSSNSSIKEEVGEDQDGGVKLPVSERI
ncbi:hypothetical protein DV735_g5544, partial [Chaetothyriales sp. CBS 134920]